MFLAVISMEKGINDESALDKLYEAYMDNDSLNLLHEEFDYMIEDLREHGIKSVKQLDEYIQKAADERQNIQEKIKAIDKEMQKLSTTMEQVHTVKKYRACYKEYKANPSDKAFFEYTRQAV